MRKEVIATGRTVEAAIEAGCEQLGVAREDTEFDIIDMPRKGFLGLSQSPAKVKVWIELPEPKAAAAPVEKPKAAVPVPRAEKPAAPAKSKPAPEQPAVQPVIDSEKAKTAAAYLTDILHAMGLPQASVSMRQEEQNLLLKLEGDNSGVAIGRRGETLDALQYLTGLAVNRLEGDYLRIVLDSGNYRDKRRTTLENLAKKLANNALRTGRSTTLEPMNPYERRIIHAAVSEIEGVTSASVGEEPNRCVVISATGRSADLQEDRPQHRDGSRGGRGGRGRRDDRRGGGRRDDRRGGRREKPEPYQATSEREVAPAEAADKPLYGKIEL